MKIAAMIFCSINQPFYKCLEFTEESWSATKRNDWEFKRLISQKIYLFTRKETETARVDEMDPFFYLEMDAFIANLL